jgi:hypothetical protein
MVFEAPAAGNRGSGGKSDDAARDETDRAADKRACERSHGAITEPLLSQGGDGCDADRNANAGRKGKITETAHLSGTPLLF